MDKGSFGEAISQMVYLDPMMLGALKARYKVQSNNFDLDFQDFRQDLLKMRRKKEKLGNQRLKGLT